VVPGISRLAGPTVAERSSWWLENRSAKRALTIVDDRGLRSVPHPGRRIVLEAPTRVVEGTRRTHT